MRIIVDRDKIRKASYENTLRLARWIGSRRLPTCDCSDCRAVVIGALGAYVETRAWVKPARRPSRRASLGAQSSG